MAFKCEIRAKTYNAGDNLDVADWNDKSGANLSLPI